MKSKNSKENLIIFLVSIILLLLIDFFAGASILKLAPLSSSNDTEKALRVKHPIYHHTLAPNYRGFSHWGGDRYRVCTNNDGLKSHCNHIINDKEYDIAFLGDSFTEGIGLPYEKTFVGLIAEKLTDKKIANLGVSSYSPTIYYLKLKEFLEKGYKFKELVVYVDISDIQDEANYSIVDGQVIDTMNRVKKPRKQKEDKKDKTFPLLDSGLKGLEKMTIRGLKEKIDFLSETEDLISKDKEIYSKSYRRSGWTFDSSNIEYGNLGVDGAIEKSLLMMNKLYDLCRDHNIKLSVGVYPWPGQVLYDNENSRQVKVWEGFCKDKCENFYNLFPTIFSQLTLNNFWEIIKHYYINGDFHFNERGNALVASNFLEIYE
jgi:hypothetical protein